MREETRFSKVHTASSEVRSHRKVKKKQQVHFIGCWILGKNADAIRKLRKMVEVVRVVPHTMVLRGGSASDPHCEVARAYRKACFAVLREARLIQRCVVPLHQPNASDPENDREIFGAGRSSWFQLSLVRCGQSEL